MVKHEIKVEIDKPVEIRNLIEKAYYEEGDHGKILGKNHFIKIDESDDVNYSIFKGLNNATVKISNVDVIDGTMRFMVDENSSELRLYPVSVYTIKENNKYIFY